MSDSGPVVEVKVSVRAGLYEYKELGSASFIATGSSLELLAGDDYTYRANATILYALEAAMTQRDAEAAAENVQ